MRWFGGRLERSQEQFPSMAVERESFPQVFDDLHLQPEALHAWAGQRTAAVVGAGLAERAGWSFGSRVTLRSKLDPSFRYNDFGFRLARSLAAISA